MLHENSPSFFFFQGKNTTLLNIFCISAHCVNYAPGFVYKINVYQRVCNTGETEIKMTKKNQKADTKQLVSSSTKSLFKAHSFFI